MSSRKAKASKHRGTKSVRTTTGLTPHTWLRLRRVPVASISYLQQQNIPMVPQCHHERKPNMSKRKHQQASQQDSGTEHRSDGQVDGSSLFVSDERPKPRVTTFVPRDCTSCPALRDADPVNAGLSFSRVYSTQGRTRYCKCGYCGATWKEVE